MWDGCRYVHSKWASLYPYLGTCYLVSGVAYFALVWLLMYSYDSHRKSKRGGGVGILLSQNLEYRQRKDLSLNVPNFESVTIEMKTHQQSKLLCTIYRSPNSSDKEFLKNYSRLLKKFTPQQLARLIIGLDHNLDLIKHAKHRVTNEFIELNLDNQLLPTITKPTRITR